MKNFFEIQAYKGSLKSSRKNMPYKNLAWTSNILNQNKIIL